MHGKLAFLRQFDLHDNDKGNLFFPHGDNSYKEHPESLPLCVIYYPIIVNKQATTGLNFYKLFINKWRGSENSTSVR